MNNMPFAGTMVRFAVNGESKCGYVTRRDMEAQELRVCVGTGDYHTVALADVTAVI